MWRQVKDGDLHLENFIVHKYIQNGSTEIYGVVWSANVLIDHF